MSAFRAFNCFDIDHDQIVMVMMLGNDAGRFDHYAAPATTALTLICGEVRQVVFWQRIKYLAFAGCFCLSRPKTQY